MNNNEKGLAAKVIRDAFLIGMIMGATLTAMALLPWMLAA